jgi:hypothetical protein
MKKIFGLLVLAASCAVPSIDNGKSPPVSLSIITDIAATSTCADVQWKNRGLAPMGYIKGMSLVYARALCSRESAVNKIVSKPKTGNDYWDALSWHESNFLKLGLKSEGGLDSLRNVYALMIGLGMRESSGRYCCGRDGSSSNFSSDNVEAGIFQTSWNASAFSSVAAKLTPADTGCFADVFKEGVPDAKCPERDRKNWGSGRGYQFQKDSKECPAYGVVFASIMLRVAGGTKGHYGPLRRKEAEIRPECVTMLAKVQEAVEANPGLCEALLK